VAGVKVEPGELRFGTVSPYADAVLQAFTITNVGQEVISLREAVLEDGSSDCFAVHSSPAPKDLLGAEQATVRIAFHPSAIGYFNATLRLTLRFPSEDRLADVERRLLGQGCADDNHDGACNVQATMRDSAELDP
jgi:hypothetical protein